MVLFMGYFIMFSRSLNSHFLLGFLSLYHLRVTSCSFDSLIFLFMSYFLSSFSLLYSSYFLLLFYSLTLFVLSYLLCYYSYFTQSSFPLISLSYLCHFIPLLSILLLLLTSYPHPALPS